MELKTELLLEEEKWKREDNPGSNPLFSSICSKYAYFFPTLTGEQGLIFHLPKGTGFLWSLPGLRNVI